MFYYVYVGLAIELLAALVVEVGSVRERMEAEGKEIEGEIRKRDGERTKEKRGRGRPAPSKRKKKKSLRLRK